MFEVLADRLIYFKNIESTLMIPYNYFWILKLYLECDDQVLSI